MEAFRKDDSMQQTVHPFVLTLIRWFREHGRDLPWRHTRDPYAIWLSEVILQQTQVKQGWAYWQRFIERWPTVEALAAATEDEVLRQWQGLGYYSRARNLHAAARQIVAMGAFPTTLEGIRSLKGVGDYTAAAIASIAFGLPVAVVDGNVYRVLSRHFGISTPINTTEGRKEFAALAQQLIDNEQCTMNNEQAAGNFQSSIFNFQSSIYNQAIMDFGALQCTPQSPRCQDCPLQETCVALSDGRVGQLPVKLKTLQVKERHLIYIYIRCQGCTAIRRRGEGDIWQGLYEPLLVDNVQCTMNNEQCSMVNVQCSMFNFQFSTLNFQPLRRGVRHVLTHRVLTADFYLAETVERPPLPPGYFWVSEAELDHYAVPRLVEKLLAHLP